MSDHCFLHDITVPLGCNWFVIHAEQLAWYQHMDNICKPIGCIFQYQRRRGSQQQQQQHCQQEQHQRQRKQQQVNVTSLASSATRGQADGKQTNFESHHAMSKELKVLRMHALSAVF